MPFSYDVSKAILDTFTSKDASWSGPTTIYVGLAKDAPSENTFGTEPSTGAYARQEMDDSAWNAASNGSADNATVITFPTCTDVNGWCAGENLTHLVFHGHVSNTDEYLGYAELTDPKSVAQNDTPKIEISAVELKLL